MRDPHATMHSSLVVITDSGRSEAWPAIERAWPSYAEAPFVRQIDLATFMKEREHVRARAALLDLGSEMALFQAVDVLRDAGLPGVLIVDDERVEKTHGACPGGVAMPRSADPAHVAIAAHALIVRQSAFDCVQRELDVSRRFQGGLRGEMDKLHEELQLAASVQQELLPRTSPEVDGAEFHVLFRPAGYVSGDIYDLQRLDEHRIGFFLADAVGHGVPAALMTMVIARGMQLKTITHAGYELHPPGEALEMLNRELVRRHVRSPRFATAMVGTIDTRTREVTLAGAGHPPALLFSADGTVERIDSHGGLLGVFEEDTFDDETFTLRDDQTLVLYTDGFETAFPAGKDDPDGARLATKVYEQRFADLARAHRDHGLAKAIEDLRAELDGASGSLHQIDDITSIVIGPKAVAASQPSPADGTPEQRAA